MASFKIGINMPGAISAGAYTAGVLDFLIEALDEWYAAKDRGAPVPMHDISIEVFSGASAGGMCAAISAALVQEEFEHIHNVTRTGSTNRFYESWVNRIDIRELLTSRDLERDRRVVSLLDSTIIDEIANYALSAGTPKSRKFISDRLTLFLTLTNLRGTPYSLNSYGSGSLEETITYHADRLRFEMVGNNGSVHAPDANPLPVGNTSAVAWPLLRTAAMATGAFPVFLAPRVITRDTADYCPPMWQPIWPPSNGTARIDPSWPPGMGATWETLNVDGGATDNDPFDLAHDYLASLAPAVADNQNPRQALEADRAVLTIAPFPAEQPFDPKYNFYENAKVVPALASLFSTLLAQSRFFGESLALIVKGNIFSRFMIGPSDTSLPPGTSALQCSSLGAFGGFFERGFRAHDYQLGRRNCQQFLRQYFVLPEGNPVVLAGLGSVGARSDEVLDRFEVRAPGNTDVPRDQKWIPIIPLCTDELRTDVPNPDRAQIAEGDLNEIVDLIDKRFKAVMPILLRDVPSAPLRLLLNAVNEVVAVFGKGKLKEILTAELGDAVAKTEA